MSLNARWTNFEFEKMINQEIYEGIKQAMARGESLQHASITFFNAGYPKQEIDAVAKALQLDQLAEKTQPGYSAKNPTSPQKIKTTSSIQTSSKKSPQKIFQYRGSRIKTPPIKSPQVSNYGEKKPKSLFESEMFVIFLGILLLLLIGTLSSLFFFRDAVVDFINNFFA
ncbi:hypothetical protein HN832_03215 [archaeon]|jgi:hypothetical protein|nr:hypothetical protein [archaeon]MBT4373594.1 hypothetical protein [archaeon]MBT4532042.1 hypothetical protein [archaeon]MBT7001709.1 hypothetical protein [archaeon]MBT7282399.1 hypothetical protein [archaeon]